MTDSKSYGKRPRWQLFVIYLVVAGIAYAGVYYLFFSDNGGY